MKCGEPGFKEAFPRFIPQQCLPAVFPPLRQAGGSGAGGCVMAVPRGAKTVLPAPVPSSGAQARQVRAFEAAAGSCSLPACFPSEGFVTCQF